MGNSFDKFSVSGRDGRGVDYNTPCRSWRNRRQRRRATTTANGANGATTKASATATSTLATAESTTESTGTLTLTAAERRCLTHVNSTPNLGETTDNELPLEPRSSSFSYGGDTDFGDSNDGMDSDTSNSSSNSKQVVVGICAMAKKTQSKPMKEILTRLGEFEFIKLVTFEEHVILREPVQNWPTCDCLVSFHSKGFPLEKAIEYAQLRNPFVLNNLHMQYDIQDRRRVYAILEKEGIEIPRYAVLDRDSPDPKHHELIESEDHVEVNGITFNKPFVEKPVSAEDHNIYIYYPTSAGGGSQRLFRKIGSRSSVYSPESRVRKTGSFIYEDFMPTDVYFSGTDVKVYTVGPDYAHAEARKSPALDGKVERDSEGKEIRYPVILNHSEKLISRKVCLAFKQTVCGFDLLRANGKSYVCDVNGFSFVKNSNKYYDDCAKILGNMILRELTPTLHIPWSVPFQLDDPPIVPTTFGKMMELRCVVAVIRHGDRTPKQKMKVEVRHPKFFEIFEKYDGYKLGHVKLKRPKQLQEILDIARFLLSEIHTKTHVEIEEKESKLEQLKNVLEMYGHFSGINRKVQMKYQPKGRPRGSSSDDEPSLVLILKWGGELTPAGRIQAEELGRIFRCMYPGGQGRSDYSGTQGLGLLRLHSTFRHDLKIYASDEGRVQMTAAAFAKGLLALEGELTPILVQMVKSANTNGLLDNDCDSSKYQNLAKGRLHELMQNDREFTSQDRELINPCNSKSINQALDFVKNPVDCCHHVLLLIRELLHIISIKKDDPKTKDAILYHGETWDLMRCRWEKIEKDFSTKSKLFDISKIPDIYDCIKYDLQHNQHTLQYDQAEELYIYAKNLADIVIPQEYGLTPQEKLAIGQGICSPLLRKIKGDLQRNIDEVEDEFMNRLNPHYSHGVASPQRHVRTRLYFTSESHVHSLLTVLRYGGLLNVVTDEQWRRAMDYISMVSELNYMSQIVIMLYEDPTKDPTSEERFHVELHFSPGVNCCVQKNLPPGPGFRPHSHSDNTCNVSVQSSEESNPSRIEEEIDIAEDTQSKKRCSLISNPRNSERISGISTERGYSSFTFNRLSSKQLKSKPIPIGAHHTVSGHEAMDLAKRLNEELASQQQLHHQQQHHTALDIRPISPDIRAVSPDCEPRSRSFEQRPTTTCGQDQDSTVSASVSSANSSTSSRRQRHSIAGQMSYMKMLGFGGFSKKMATSANSLFSTAVISGSSSAPNLRDMIPVSSSGFGDVPPIRPLETLHNALSLRKLDSFLQDMIFAQIFKTPTGSPPRVVELPISTVSSMTLNQREEGTVPSILHRGPSILTCESCDRGGSEAGSNVDNVLRRTVGSIRPESAVENLESNYDLTKMAMAKKLLWQQQQQQDSLQSEEMAQEPLAKMPALSGVCSGLMPIVDIHTVDVDVEADLEATAEAELGAYAPMNQDTLDGGVFLSVCAGSASSDRDEKSSACLTPVSFGMDLSMVANKGSMTLSVDGFDDDEEATLSAGTTPSLPMDEPQLETCYCCPSHAGHMEPPDVEVDDPKFNFALTMPLAVPDTRVTHASPERVAVHAGAEAVDDDGGTFNKSNVRRAHDPISPRIQKQISLFESGGFECAGSSSGLKDNSALHASINLPAAGSSQLLRQDARLRKFENLTQSTSNSNFPFESNTLKRAPMPAKDYADVSHTQSCINLKSNAFACCSGAAVAAGGGGGGGGGCVGSQAGHGPESVSGVTTASVSSYSSPRHQAVAAHAAGVTAATHYRLCNALSACSSLDATPHPGALIVKECFIEPPKRIIRGYNGKTQSMDADFLFNEFLLLPAMASTLPHTSDGTNSGSNTPSTRFLTAKLSLDEPESPAYAAAAAAAAASSGPGSGSVPASQQQRK
ncbi:inositol hexakisphosphate and diphosphoinositol-pentakisphosphate kinase isoform X2 [Scaptodrosophila lebanonensis]|uniref:Inositol hexakisphosphate and diphosphoinositol-pentakisphosphate kinase n=1 Tax=Drosophila lebanonensis TaxID=7225 RepID=A0A6J2TRC2_DROLE|nr:inositol hexakisphosphate and diphosphoinositol-pentakisphosphate kinase isoform X2 [Scaptodrosophila lebanonensis]